MMVYIMSNQEIRLAQIDLKRPRTRKHKWSLKYKRSIDCNHPKGFSQRQHCKYGRKNMRKLTRKK